MDASRPDPARVNSVTELGRELTLARDLAGLTVRQVQKLTKIINSTLGGYFSGRHLPSLDNLNQVLEACGISDLEERDAWRDALLRARRARRCRPDRCDAVWGLFLRLVHVAPEVADTRRATPTHLRSARTAACWRSAARTRPCACGTSAGASTDGIVLLWAVDDPAAAHPSAVLTGPTDAVFSVVWSPDGAQLAAGSADRTVRLWSADPGDAVAALCAATGAPPSAQEWARFVPDLSYDPPCRS